MNIFDYYKRQLPEYYPFMHLDGYTPEQVYASYRKMLGEMYSEAEPTTNINFSYEVKSK